MQENFYNVAFSVYESGVVKRNGSCLIRSSKVPTLDAARAHIRKYYLNDSAAVINFSQVASISKEVYLKLGGDPNAPLLKTEDW